MNDIKKSDLNQSFEEAWDDAIEKSSAEYEHMTVSMHFCNDPFSFFLCFDFFLFFWYSAQLNHVPFCYIFFFSFLFSSLTCSFSRNNCHNHVCRVLNRLEYKGFTHWNSVTLVGYLTLKARYVR
jgi:hypothetical protein